MPTVVEGDTPKKYFSNLPVHIVRVGRPHGVRNKISHSVKENIQKVFDGLGGWESMLDWAVTHRNEFYGEVYPRLLAKEGVSQHGQITVIVQRNSDPISDDVLDLHASTQDAQAEPQAEADLRSESTNNCP